MSYHGLGVTASASLNFSGGGFSASGSAGGGSAGSGSSGDYIWDSTCNLGSRGGTKQAVADASGFTFSCNNGYACKGGPGKTTTCTTPGVTGTSSGPPAPIGPCGSVGARASNAKNGYTYTYCNDDRMYVRDPNGKFEVFSQKEVGGAFNAGSAIMPKAPATTTLNASSLFSKPATTLNASSLFSKPATTLATTSWMFQPARTQDVVAPPPQATPVDDGLSTGAMVGIAVGAVALIGGVVYLATRGR
jgi:hypothetical protein